MKKIFYSAVLLLLMAGCSKDKTVFIESATMNVINATVGSASVKVNTGLNRGFAWSKTTAADELIYGSNMFYALNAGSNMITVVKTADTTKTLFAGSLKLESINTLYLAGTSAAVDTMLRVERNLPVIDIAKKDREDAAYIRFVNLSPNSPPLSVNIQSAGSNEVTALPYKGIGGFKKYAAVVNAADYIFEIRNTATNAVLTTFQIGSNDIRFRTMSIVIGGIVDGNGADALSAFAVTYYNNNN